MRRTLDTSILLLGAAMLCACTSRPGTVPADAIPADPRAQAEALAIRAGALLDADRAGADRLLTEALAKDAYCGVAHNNRGTLQLTAEPPDLAGAAESFQTAARLMPGRPDPRLNLGLVMERAGRMDDALAAYQSAVESSPQHMPSIQALTSIELRLGQTTEHTNARLKSIALAGTTPAWRSWAQDRLLRSQR